METPMTRLATAALAVGLAAAAPAAALAQSYTAPAGIPTETAPGAATTFQRGWTAPIATDVQTTGSVSRPHRVPAARR
jgi:hypothetical protein